jgi:tripartite-type tricarboxylate transporter receptor subunit TctC
MNNYKTLCPVAVVLAFSLANANLSYSADTSDLYKGKTFSVLINYSAGGPTDIEGRLFARNIGRHIPGKPLVLSKNMAGSAGVVAANFLGLKAKADGMMMGYFTNLAAAYAFKPLKDKGLRVDPANFKIIATVSGLIISYIRSDVAPGIKKAEDIMKTNGFTVGGSSVYSQLDLEKRLMLDLLGLKYQYVTGYRGASKTRVALMQNEIQFSSESQPSFRSKVIPTLVEPGTVTPLFYHPLDDGNQVISSPDDVKGLGILGFHEFYEKVKGKKPSGIKWKALRSILRFAGSAIRTLVLPPGSSQSSVNTLRKAVAALARDPAYAADAKKSIGFVPRFRIGAEAEELIRVSTRLEPDVVAFLKEYVAKAKNRK